MCCAGRRRWTLCPPAQAKALCTASDLDAVSAAHQPDPSSFVANESGFILPNSRKRKGSGNSSSNNAGSRSRSRNSSSSSSSNSSRCDDKESHINDCATGNSLNVQYGTYQVWSRSGAGQSGDAKDELNNGNNGGMKRSTGDKASVSSSESKALLTTTLASELEHISFMTVELNPGDALFIPSGWWHLVEAVNCEHSVAVNWYFQPPTASSESSEHS